MIKYYAIVVERAQILTGWLQTCSEPEGGLRFDCVGTRSFGFERRGAVLSILNLAICLLVCVCFLSFLALPAFAQGSISEGRDALKSKAYPWYDAETDGTRPMELGERPDARSANRDEIPLRNVKPKKNNAPYTPPAGGAGGGKFGSSLLGGLTAMTWAMIVFFVMLVIGVLIWAMLRMSSQSSLQDDEAFPKRSMAESIKQLPFELDSPTGDFRQQVDVASAAGDYRKAITLLFSHMLVTLDQKGLIRLRKGKTNRQYLNELSPHQSLANYFQQVMVPFEATFFGDHELSKRDFDACWNQVDSFEAGVDHASRMAVTSRSGLSSRVANA